LALPIPEGLQIKTITAKEYKFPDAFTELIRTNTLSTSNHKRQRLAEQTSSDMEVQNTNI
jgi:hypothetical protein